MKTLEELIAIVNKSNRTQLWYMIYDFEMMGFYREDKRVQKKFLIGCLENNYTTSKENWYRYRDSIDMEKAILENMSK